MAFAIVGVAKQKGGSVGSSGHHNDRTRETPNADPERLHENRVLLGDDRNVREAVDRIIEEHGGKPRRDSVEAIEYVLTASPEWFDERDPQKYREKVDRFTEQAVKFLEDPRSGGKVAKVVLHLDERTPHIQAHKVPIDPDGKLNCKHYLGGREKMRAMHDLYASYMEPLGLERGREGSRARHQTLKQFYASIEQEVELKIDHERVPDPPRVSLTREKATGYKERVLKAVLEQLKEQIQTLRYQALLTKDERVHREEAGRRAETAERQAAERIAAAEREAEERIGAVRREEAGRYEDLRRSALQLLEENREQHREKEALRKEVGQLQESLKAMKREKLDYAMRAKDYSDRLTDIPMEEVMQRLGYEGENHKGVLIYRGEQNEVAMLVLQQKAYDKQRELICKNSLDLVVYMKQENERLEGFDRNAALAWLQDEFGDRRAHGAYVANREQSALEFFGRRNEERERTRELVRSHSVDPWRGPQGRDEDRDRGSRAHDIPDRGGSSFDR